MGWSDMPACPVMLVPHKTVQMTSFEVKAASGIESQGSWPLIPVSARSHAFG